MLAIGSDLDGVQTQNFAQPQPETLIAVSLEPLVNYRVDIHLDGDAGEVTAALAAGVRDARRPRRARRAALRASAPRPAARSTPPRLRFLDAIRFAVPADGVLVVDMCIPGYWLAGFHTPAAPRRLQVPLGWGTLGYAFPAALGAALAGADGPVVSISGDGGFLFACGELATMAQEQIPLTAVIVDDGGYGMLRYDQGRRATRPTASTSTPRTSPPSPPPSASTPRPSTASTTASARPSPATPPTRPRPSSSPAPRPRSSRRPTPRRTGTAEPKGTVPLSSPWRRRGRGSVREVAA